MALAYLAILLGIPYLLFENVIFIFEIVFFVLTGKVSIQEIIDIIGQNM